MRSPPRLESRENAYSIDVTYCGEAAPKGKILPLLKERILGLEIRGEECVSTEDRQNVIWLRNNFSLIAWFRSIMNACAIMIFRMMSNLALGVLTGLPHRITCRVLLMRSKYGVSFAATISLPPQPA